MDDGWIRTERGTLIKRYGPPRSRPAPSDYPTPMVIGDSMDPTEHIDGKFYDSKAKFRAVTKAHGCIEVGNDPARLRRKPKATPDKKAIKEAVGKAIHQVLGT